MTTTTVLAWHGDQALRDRIVQRMYQHREADAFVQGMYQEVNRSLPLGYQGCAIGCLLDPGADPVGDPCERWWVQVEEQFGIHRDVAEAIDDIFESYDSRDGAGDFAVDAIEAIPVGADLTEVAEWCRAECVTLEREAGQLLEQLRSAPIPARADR
jgi:hypothetical protein